MGSYLLKRVPSAIGVLLVASVVIFALIRLVPGDPVDVLAGPDASAESRAVIRADLGLDQPFLTQYLHWVSGLLRLDLGQSYVIGGDVGALVAAGAVNTIVLSLTALLSAVLLALITSTAAVILDRSWLNNALAAINTVAVALPTFATGLVLVLVFAVLLPVLPSGGTPPDGFIARPDIAVQYLLLPATVLALPAWASLSRYLTEALHSQLDQPYLTTARAAGIGRRRLVLAHALPNALPATITVLGIQFGNLLGGAVIVEAIFTWPGLGRLIEQAISLRDYPVVQLLLVLSVAAFIITQLLTDVINAWLDPRIRLAGAR